jgi:uncharacterized protein YcbK (DUF882 family)
MSNWRYFNDKEVAGLCDDLVFKLDRARGIYGAPIIITSGLRTPERNSEIGGVSDSSHLEGAGADLRAPQGQFLREKLAWSLGVAGIMRIGFYPRHMHVDVDINKPMPACWEGEYHEPAV